MSENELQWDYTLEKWLGNNILWFHMVLVMELRKWKEWKINDNVM